MTTVTMLDQATPSASALEWFGIADVALKSGLTQDTLRWYEREGLLPAVERGADGRRRYSERSMSLVVMLAKLRSTGMPTDEMRRFSQLVGGDAVTHGQRMALLESHRERIHERQAVLDDGLDALEGKIGHYRFLIDGGLDCDGIPVSAELARSQRSPVPIAVR